jgi:hypothetical protein
MLVRRIRLLLLFEAATFLIAAAVHGGWFINGYEHREARIAETVIAVVLLAGLAMSWIVSTRAAGLAAQGFALLGTLVGIFTIAIGVGPHTTPDILYHIGIVIVLLYGLIVAWRMGRA